MSTAPLPPTTVPAPITSVQPGGGFCMRLELAWGRFRRGFLRRFRPDYVQFMAAKRQGDCPNCPHEIIDPRDLKYWRNVCGYSFKPEDDAFLWRDHLGLARLGLGELVIFSLLFMGLSLLLVILSVGITGLFAIFLLPLFALWAIIAYFFRDPDRTIPADPDALLSPADGTITDIGEVDEPDFPGGRAFRIGIFLSVFDVHVNRAPRSCRVVNIRYFPGGFRDARDPQAGSLNEQTWIDLEEAGTGRQMRLKQISGKLARRIVCWLRAEDRLGGGERIGMIKLGSRTELYLPAGTPLETLVQIGTVVYGGSTILLRFKK